MKSIILVLFLLSFLFPQFVYSHSGVQKRGDNTIVTFYQSPISPLVGEEVKITFSVTDLNLDRKPNSKGTLTLIDTFKGDESKDTVILTKLFKTDENGSAEFSYTFDKENHFSLNLQFDGQKEKWQHIDYLIYPRAAGKIITRVEDLRLTQMIFMFGLGSLITLLLTKTRQYINNRNKHS